MTLRQFAAAAAIALASPAFAANNKADVQVFDIGQEVAAIAVTQDGSAVWFCQSGNQQIGRLDVATGAVRYWAIPSKSPTGDYYAGGQPYDIVIDDAGDVWFNELPGRGGYLPAYVTRFKPATEEFQQFLVNPMWWNGYAGSIWLGQGGLVKAADGKIWFTDKSGRPVIGSIDPASGAVSLWDPGMSWNRDAVTRDIAVSSTGRIYVSDGLGVGRVDATTGAIERIPELTSAMLATEDAFGSVWFNAQHPDDAGTWGLFSPVRIADDGSITWFRGTVPGWYGQMATDALGHVWVPHDVYDSYSTKRTLAEIDPWKGTTTTYELPFVPEFVSINGDRMALSRSYVASPGQIGIVRDLDRDGDGVMGKQDCNDRDPGMLYPGATEIKLDGKDQDCNGYDLTIQVAKATYKAGATLLRVEATSALGAAAALQVTGFGPMKWDALTSRWVLNVTTAKVNPGNVTVCGVEGCDFPFGVIAL